MKLIKWKKHRKQSTTLCQEAREARALQHTQNRGREREGTEQNRTLQNRGESFREKRKITSSAARVTIVSPLSVNYFNQKSISNNKLLLKELFLANEKLTTRGRGRIPFFRRRRRRTTGEVACAEVTSWCPLPARRLRGPPSSLLWRIWLRTFYQSPFRCTWTPRRIYPCNKRGKSKFTFTEINQGQRGREQNMFYTRIVVHFEGKHKSSVNWCTTAGKG